MDLGRSNTLLENLRRAQQVVKEVSVKEVIFHKNQCQILLTKLSEILKNVKNDTQRYGKVLQELYLLTQRVKILVDDCCYTDSGDTDVILAAIKLTDSDERFLKHHAEIEWCQFLVNCINESPENDPFIHDLGKFDWEETLRVLRAKPRMSKAASEDRKQIIKVLKKTLGEAEAEDDHRKLCQLLLARFSGGPVHATVDDQQLFLEYVQKLGEGGYGEVWEVKWRNCAFAVKQLKKDINNRSKFIEEAEILERMRHPNILNMICSYDHAELNGSSLVIIMTERMEMDLKKLICAARDDKPSSSTQHPFTLLEAVDIILQVAEGMLYLHNSKVAHRDLKPGNILINKTPVFQAKVGDFGLAKEKNTMLSEDVTPNIGTTRYMAPELFGPTYREAWFTEGRTRNNSLIGRMWSGAKGINRVNSRVRASNFRADVYSFAITSSEVITGIEPYKNVVMGDVRSKVTEGARPQLPPTCPPRLSSLLKKCWDEEPQKRPGFSEICKELRILKAVLLTERFDIPNCPKPEVEEDHSRGLLNHFQGVQNGSGEIVGFKLMNTLLLGNSERANVMDYICGSSVNLADPRQSSPYLPMTLHNIIERDEVRQIDASLKFLSKRNAIWTVDSIYRRWYTSLREPLHLTSGQHRNPSDTCSTKYHMVWVVYRVGRSPGFEWYKLIKSKLTKEYQLPVVILVLTDTGEDPKGDLFKDNFLSKKDYLFPEASEEEQHERIVKVDAAALASGDSDLRARLWIMAQGVQIRSEIRFAARIILRIREELGRTGVHIPRSSVAKFSKEYSLAVSASFIFKISCKLFSVPDDFRDFLHKKLQVWEPSNDTREPGVIYRPGWFMHFCVRIVGIIVFSKGLHPCGWSCTKCGDLSWVEEVDAFLQNHPDKLDEQVLRPENYLYKYLNDIFEEGLVKSSHQQLPPSPSPSSTDSDTEDSLPLIPQPQPQPMIDLLGYLHQFLASCIRVTQIWRYFGLG